VALGYRARSAAEQGSRRFGSSVGCIGSQIQYGALRPQTQRSVGRVTAQLSPRLDGQPVARPETNGQQQRRSERSAR
jgi:hypothetical protein